MIAPCPDSLDDYTEADIEQLDDIQAELARLDLLPDRQLVDAGYVRARNVVESRDRHQVDLVGPIFQDRQWQAMAGEGFDASHFRIDWERKEAISPEGKRSVGWSEPSTGRQRTKQKVRFASEDCRICSSQSKCTRSRLGFRALLLPSREQYEAPQAARKRQQTEAFAEEYARRAGIEGTISEGVRAYGLQRARYRGLGKTHLQRVVTAAAVNLGRLDNWLNGVPIVSSRVSRFAALVQAN